VYIQNQIWVWKNIPAYTTNLLKKGEKKKPWTGRRKRANFFIKKTLVLTLGSLPEKGVKKKTLVLTLGSPPEKGVKKKNPGINPGQPVGKGRGKKNLGINSGQRHLKYTKAGSAIKNAEAGSAIECKAIIDEA
jgi:hypothetical protein